MADRYAYISFIGLYIISCWGVTDLISLVERSWRFQGRRHISAGPAALVKVRSIPFALLSALCLASLFALSALTYRQVGYWRDNLSLWYHAVAVVKHDWIADDEIGLSLERMGRPEQEVLPYFYKAAEIEYSDRLSNSQIGYTTRHTASHARQSIAFKECCLTPILRTLQLRFIRTLEWSIKNWEIECMPKLRSTKPQTCDS